MMRNEIINIFEIKEFINVQVNIEEISLLYKVVNEKAYVISLFWINSGKILTNDQYDNIIRQVKKNFDTRYKNGLDILCILCTDDLESTKKTFGEDDNVWIVDNKKHRLIIYENQPKDFLNVRVDIEEAIFNSANNTNTNLYKKDKGVRDFLCTISFSIIAINVLVYVLVNKGLLISYPRVVIHKAALYWPDIFYNHEYYRVITYMFLHKDISHITNNMLILLIIGESLEKVVGKVRFSVIYLVTGIVAGISSACYNMIIKYNVISFGASGAIFGVIGAMLYIVLINKGRIHNISKSRMILFVGMILYSGLTSQRVDNIAHVSGLITGVILAALLYRKDKKLLGRD